MTAKEKYELFCQNTYVPIYSKPWWLDAVCLPENWDVWIYEDSGTIFAAMPFHFIGDLHKKIVKPPLTQNNGIIFNYPADQKPIKRAEFENKICEEAIQFIENLGIESYEQQFHYSFTNHLPFFWNYFSFMPRFTYVIEDTSSMTKVFDNYSSNCRKNIKKGIRNIDKFASISKESFWEEHEQVFLRQGLPCPFSQELWYRIFEACETHKCGKILTAQNSNSEVLSLAYIIKDEQSMYLLLGGSNPQHSSLQTYSALINYCIESASKEGLKFDFEGSVIKRINQSYRQFGGVPKLYYRIQKLYTEDLIRQEAEEKIRRLKD